MRADYIIVGSGLTGATIARTLLDRGCDVLVVERRDYIGGNVADTMHASGIRMQRHGPHYFRTSSPDVWEFVNRFTSFHPFEAAVKTRIDGRLENWPIAGSYLREAVGDDWQPAFRGTPTNFEEAALSLMPECIYKRFVKPYSEKQWGAPAETLHTKLCKRFDVRADDDPRLTPKARWQGIPAHGYSRMVEDMLRGVRVETGRDYLRHRHAYRANRLTIFTGPIDLYFDCVLGRLQYRGQERATEYLPDDAWKQPCVQINEPSASAAHLRTIEWKHMMPEEDARRIRGTLLTRETAFSPDDADQYEYPFPDRRNDQLYARYAELARRQSRVLFCGRLGEYRYYDMDQAIARALTLAQRILAAEPVGATS